MSMHEKKKDSDYYDKHKSELLKKQKKWNQDNMERRRIAKQKWLKKNPNYYKDYHRKNRKANTKAVLAWRKTHKKEYNEYMRDLQRKLRAEKKSMKNK